jgi:hypothetical protein
VPGADDDDDIDDDIKLCPGNLSSNLLRGIEMCLAKDFKYNILL